MLSVATFFFEFSRIPDAIESLSGRKKLAVECQKGYWHELTKEVFKGWLCERQEAFVCRELDLESRTASSVSQTSIRGRSPGSIAQWPVS